MQLPFRTNSKQNAVKRVLTGVPFALGFVAGLAGEFLLDPQNGKRRRREIIQRTGGRLRRSRWQVDRQARYAAGFAQGAAHKFTPGTGQDKGAEELGDAGLARKVETEIFREADAPKGTVDVNVENGVVYLRGQVKRPEDIERLVEKARSVDGVTQVESLLHTPQTPAPMKS